MEANKFNSYGMRNKIRRATDARPQQSLQQPQNQVNNQGQVNMMPIEKKEQKEQSEEQREEQRKAELERIREEARKEAEQRAQQAFEARLQALETRLKEQENENKRIREQEAAREVERKNQEEARLRQETEEKQRREVALRQEAEERQKQEDALRQAQRAFEEKQQHERDRLRQVEIELQERETRILAQVRETAQKLSVELEQKNRAEEKELKEKVDTQGGNLQPDERLDAEILKAIEKRRERKALLEALQSIVNDPKTIVKRKPVIDNRVYPEHAPFTDKEKWVGQLEKGSVPILSETIWAILELDDPFNAKLDELARNLKISMEEMAKLHLEIEVNDLDNEFGMATRRKRVLNGKNLLASSSNGQSNREASSNREEGELMFGANKDRQAVVLHFDTVARGSYKIREVVAEDIRDYRANIVDHQGIVVKGTKAGNNTSLYNTTRKQKAGQH